MSSGVAIKPRVIKSSDEYPVASRGSLMASGSHGPPCGLKTAISYPRSENQKYGCVSSLHQKPTGHPVVVEVAGFEMTIATRFRDLGFTTFGSLMLMRAFPCQAHSAIDASTRAFPFQPNGEKCPLVPSAMHHHRAWFRFPDAAGSRRHAVRRRRTPTSRMRRASTDDPCDETDAARVLRK